MKKYMYIHPDIFLEIDYFLIFPYILETLGMWELWPAIVKNCIVHHGRKCTIGTCIYLIQHIPSPFKLNQKH